MTDEISVSNPHSEASRHRSFRRISLSGPVFLITLGAIFLLSEIAPAWGVRKTWPLLLIVIGITKLFEAFAAKPAGRTSPKPEKESL